MTRRIKYGLSLIALAGLATILWEFGQARHTHKLPVPNGYDAFRKAASINCNPQQATCMIIISKALGKKAPQDFGKVLVAPIWKP